MVAAGGVRGTDHAAHFGGVFAGKDFVGSCIANCLVVFFHRAQICEGHRLCGAFWRGFRR